MRNKKAWIFWESRRKYSDYSVISLCVYGNPGYRVQIWTKNHGMLETIISARSIGHARMLAQEQYPDARIGCVTQAD